ncbi:hypothetical protein P43SY_003592 [Pythium insidiosum]|uniref:Uncharacterized protein n=1 Tax=Pythium insidiosum TaxID=114742 RepID=A0AAD5Q7P6_PYTIN|nr:hypothetical protein P43SY_003592 [Pythium insidiosum]
MDIHRLVELIRSLHLQPDASLFNETEFVLGMHLIVCRTKRGLDDLPAVFPTHLFPSLALPAPAPTPATSVMSTSHADLISSMPSPEKPATADATPRQSFTSGMLAAEAVASNPTPRGSMTSAAPGTITKLQQCTSLLELLRLEIENTRTHTTVIQTFEQGESRTLQHLHASLDEIIAAVERLGFPVPPSTSSRTIGGLDDVGNLFRQHVQSLKQEIQSMEISARMLAVADEATSPSKRTASVGPEMLHTIGKLTQELTALQQEASKLAAKRDALALQALERKTSAVPSSTSVSMQMQPPAAPKTSSGSSLHGAFESAAVAPLGAPQEMVRKTESVAGTGMGQFDAGAFSQPTTQPQEIDWGSF